MRHIVLFFTCVLLVGATACSLFPNQNTPAADPIDTATPTVPATIRPSQINPEPADPEVITATRRLLTVWLPDELAPESSENSVLEQQIRSFAAAQTDLDVRIEYKMVNGQGGILNYLRTGRPVAPTILPDAVVLPMEQLETAAAGELIYPMNDFISPELVADLFPVALDYATQEDLIPGYPFAVTNLTHLAYKTTTISQTVPTDWETLRTIANGSFVFPANGEAGATLILQMYLNAGGQLVNEADQPQWIVEPLAQSLEQLTLARNDGFLVRQSNTLTTFPQAWEVYETGLANLMLVDAHTFLTMRDQVPETAVSPIPGIIGEATPLVNGWAWAISTNDSTQRELAGSLITTLIAPENLADWSLRTGHLPAPRSAFSFWPADDPYTSFLQTQLELAQSHPFTSGSDTLRTLRTAVFNVVNLTETPQEAAESTVNSLNP